ncbi:MAG: Thioredoxin [Sporanaerobacter sp.]|jgi:thiol-disulfide isomerase/thioredoxin|uniref:thioredoxin family protein n=1 Tax=Sporanaerobacter sp. TaxID=2010183 RepID=UPI003A101640
MEAKEIFERGVSFEDFVNMDSNSYREKTLEIYDSLSFKEESIERIKSIDKKINILICAEIWCPDCMINVPIVEKMRQINENIHISIVGKEENKDFFKVFNIEENIVRIPTFVFYDEYFTQLGSFVERPTCIKKVYNSGNQPSIIVTMRKYRKGEYVEETLKEVLEEIGY